MSIKIYNGYKTKILKSTEIGDFVHKLRQDLINKRIEKFDKIYGGVDNYHTYSEKYEKVRISKENFDDFMPIIDFSAEALFYFIEDKTLITFYSPLLEREFAELDYIEDYHYQNQTDCDEVSYEEYEERFVDWEKAMGEDLVASQRGLSFKVFDSKFYYKYWWDMRKDGEND